MFQREGSLSPVLIDSVMTAESPSSSPAFTPTARDHEAVAARRPAPREEALVLDERSGLRPACVVESKLTRLLKEASLPASRLQMRAMLKAR